MLCRPQMQVGKRPRPVLIVDDDEALLELEQEVLREHGIHVTTARNGAEALIAMQQDPPSVIVLDIQMPGIDGPSFARELRQQLRHVPLVVLTAAADPRHEADRCNAEAFLAKPFDAEELVRVIRRFAA